MADVTGFEITNVSCLLSWVYYRIGLCTPEKNADIQLKNPHKSIQL